jgi:hypothetical protein
MDAYEVDQQLIAVQEEQIEGLRELNKLLHRAADTAEKDTALAICEALFDLVDSGKLDTQHYDEGSINYGVQQALGCVRKAYLPTEAEQDAKSK